MDPNLPSFEELSKTIARLPLAQQQQQQQQQQHAKMLSSQDQQRFNLQHQQALHQGNIPNDQHQHQQYMQPALLHGPQFNIGPNVPQPTLQQLLNPAHLYNPTRFNPPGGGVYASGSTAPTSTSSPGFDALLVQHLLHMQNNPQQQQQQPLVQSPMQQRQQSQQPALSPPTLVPAYVFPPPPKPQQQIQQVQQQQHLQQFSGISNHVDSCTTSTAPFGSPQQPFVIQQQQPQQQQQPPQLVNSANNNTSIEMRIQQKQQMFEDCISDMLSSNKRKDSAAGQKVAKPSRMKLLAAMKSLKHIVSAYNHIYNHVLTDQDRAELDSTPPFSVNVNSREAKGINMASQQQEEASDGVLVNNKNQQEDQQLAQMANNSN